MSAPADPADLFDVFLSHHSHNKDWVRGLKVELEYRGVSAYLDERELPEQDSWVEGLSAAGLCRCRFLLLAATRQSLTRPWVNWEWQTFMALSGPLGRVIPVLLEDVPLPPALAVVQAIRADRLPLAEVADQIARRVARLKALPPDDPGHLAQGRVLAFDLRRDGDGLRVVGPEGKERPAPSPLHDGDFLNPLGAFRRLVQTRVESDADRAELVKAATAVGRGLAAVLFAGSDAERLAGVRVAGARPLLVLGGDDELLALPWELLHDGTDFLLREGRVDLIRTTRAAVDEGCLLTEPEGPFTLVINVSAPAGQSELSYEAESYRLTRALTERCPMTPTELGELNDLVATVQRVKPTGVHFSGHGGPGCLIFEDKEGQAEKVDVTVLADRLRRERRDRLPPFFYLACCHGNDVGEGAESAAARLHREGVAQVVGYSGPVVDELSTRAEEALYRALAAGETTRQAVREARAALLRPVGQVEERHRDPGSGAAVAATDSFPFAWSQLVLYHRGPDYPLGKETTTDQLRQAEQALRRTFEGMAKRRVLKDGFIGRRRELHRVRRLLDEGKRVLVLQGLGGLGKSTLAFHIPPLLGAGKEDVCVLWCEGAEKDANPVEALVAQLLEYCRQRFGVEWEGVVQKVDRMAEDSAQRFALFLQVLLGSVPRLVLILDNMESLLVGPAEVATERPDERAFGQWRSEGLRALWGLLREAAEGSKNLWLVATCRYQNDDFLDVVLPVTPLPPDALFRLTGWFETLQGLAAQTRALLAGRLEGHPRAVEYAEDLVKARLRWWQRQHGPWRLPESPSKDDLQREWAELVEPVLPGVRDKLWANLLLGALWDNVLDERQRRMLFRMTLLRMPWEWGLMAHLGDAGQDTATAEAAAEELCRTSLLETTELVDRPHYTLHPATAAYIKARYPDDAALQLETHRRVGVYLEQVVQQRPYIEDIIEAGHHLFEAGAYDRAFELLGGASDWLRDRGRVREGLRVLEPFLAEGVQPRMQKPLVGRLLGTVGSAYGALGHPQRAIEFYQQRLVIAREVGDRTGEGTALGNLGIAYKNLGQPQRAIECHQQCLAIVREVGDRTGEGTALGNLGNAYAEVGHLQRAVALYQEALVIAREITDRYVEYNVLGSLGNAYLNLRQPQRAIEFYQQALAIAREVGYRQGECNALGGLGIAYKDLGQPQRAIECYQQCLAIVREVGNRDGEGTTLGNLGLAYAALGQPQRAIEFYQQHLAIAREVGDRQGEAITSWNMGDELVKLGRVAEAVPLMEVRVRFYQEIGHPDAEKCAAYVEQLRQRLAQG